MFLAATLLCSDRYVWLLPLYAYSAAFGNGKVPKMKESIIHTFFFFFQTVVVDFVLFPVHIYFLKKLLVLAIDLCQICIWNVIL